jgi:hypothetical protein
MRCLLLSSALLILAGCGSVYKNLQTSTGNADCLVRFRPVFTSSLYTTHVNVYGRHLSGLLLFKPLSDTSTRVVFSNEFGIKFFDFEFFESGNFKVHYITGRMNKKVVITALRKDFEMILMKGIEKKPYEVLKAEGNNWYAYQGHKEKDYYITDSACQDLVRIEKGTKRKPKLAIIMKGYHDGVPDTIGITHKLFDLNIGLKYIQR